MCTWCVICALSLQNWECCPKVIWWGAASRGRSQQSHFQASARAFTPWQLSDHKPDCKLLQSSERVCFIDVLLIQTKAEVSMRSHYISDLVWTKLVIINIQQLKIIPIVVHHLFFLEILVLADVYYCGPHDFQWIYIIGAQYYHNTQKIVLTVTRSSVVSTKITINFKKFEYQSCPWEICHTMAEMPH